MTRGTWSTQAVMLEQSGTPASQTSGHFSTLSPTPGLGHVGSLARTLPEVCPGIKLALRGWPGNKQQ